MPLQLLSTLSTSATEDFRFAYMAKDHAFAKLFQEMGVISPLNDTHVKAPLDAVIGLLASTCVGNALTHLWGQCADAHKTQNVDVDHRCT